MNLGVIGTGYVGLVTGACLADRGHRVVCVDVIPEKVEALQAGRIPIHEPGLDEIVARAVTAGRLTFTTSLAEAVAASEVLFVCVGTPTNDDGEADLKYVFEAVDGIVDAMDAYRAIVIKSTVPPGSCRTIESHVLGRLGGRCDCDVVSNPEFLAQGNAVDDFLRPERVVIGAVGERASEKMRRLYYGFEAPVLVADPTTAEMIKYASNTFLATKLSYINAVSQLCEKTGADVTVVANAMGLDARIGPQFLKAGPGFGGSCLPKDTKALISAADKAGYDFRLLKDVLEVNRAQQEAVVGKVEALCGGSVDGKVIGVLGVTFKADTDDTRESPSLVVIQRLVGAGAKVRAYDPTTALADAVQKGAEPLPDPYAVAKDADVLVLMTEWGEFAILDFERVRSLMKRPAVVDSRNYLDKAGLLDLGFEYVGMGRP